jgi:hypothetical protein
LLKELRTSFEGDALNLIKFYRCGLETWPILDWRCMGRRVRLMMSTKAGFMFDMMFSDDFCELNIDNLMTGDIVYRNILDVNSTLITL